MPITCGPFHRSEPIDIRVFILLPIFAPVKFEPPLSFVYGFHQHITQVIGHMVHITCPYNDPVKHPEKQVKARPVHILANGSAIMPHLYCTINFIEIFKVNLVTFYTLLHLPVNNLSHTPTYSAILYL